MQKISRQGPALATALLTLVLMAWDLSSLDLTLAHWWGGSGGFPLQENWFLTTVAHDGARRAAWVVTVGLCVAAWWPPGWLKRLDFARRLQLAATPLLAVSLVSLLKSFSAISCPWGLAEFGGVAHYSAHWAQLLQLDGGSGGCFPAGHAASGFAFVGGYFAFRETSPFIARRWLASAVLAGLVLGAAQQMRGAHFMSHTLWTGWICWCVAWALDAVRVWAGQRGLMTPWSDPA
ncbi:MAG: phosphatase PAP2 family protein [Polaromonas sp.]|uniref:phosphatase PAP2 family protein n=1 Tax=Polaromonas sp. TaxID=1869339 RepID=UPI0017D9B97F|nr:phosphatase PAP2 family protein [Polaromonas sp.]MBA3595302.1 phosphatase PAP2 family protein [Polaromonas sp.]